MAIADVYAAVGVEMTALLTADGQSAILPSYTFGPSAKREGNVPPRVAWLLGSDKFITPRLQGSPNNPFPGQPRSLLTHVVSLGLEIWGPCQLHSPVVRLGQRQGTVVPSGQAVSSGSPTMYGMAIKVIAGGSVGTATFQWSTDSGQSWSSTTATAASVTLGSTGVMVAFSGTFQSGDILRWIAHDYAIQDFATTEYLLTALLSALRHVLMASAQITGGVWENQDSSDTTQEGKVYTLSVEIEFPVLEMTSPLVVSTNVTSIQQTDIVGSTTTIP